jgi:signal transduction histidine kinase
MFFNMKQSIKTRLSFAIAIIVLLTVVLVSILANLFINEQFNSYISRQQKQKTEEIVSTLSQQYNKNTDTWNIDFIHTIGMSALYEGYIINVYDIQNKSIWDAQSHDMSLCKQVMDDISKRMETKYPKINGQFTSQTFDLTRDNIILGSVNISCFGPYFLSENDFRFLDSLNIVLVLIGAFSLLFSIIIGIFMAKRLSSPILKTVDAAKQISDGNYKIRINEKTDTREIDLLIRSINNLAESLEKQGKLRKQLTEDVSHELRTPIAVLQSHVEAMIEGIWEPTVERLQSCNDEVTRIGNLVGELENLAKIDNEDQKLNKTKIDLSEITNKAIKSFEAMIKVKDLHVSLISDCSYISADGDKISHAVVNLLSNAIKYTENGGKIDINISETKESAILSIRDNGIGIPADEQPFIFERFYRADKSRNRKTGGSGLGLAIVKSIVEAHGGKVSVQSQIKKGSCFEIILPK